MTISTSAHGLALIRKHEGLRFRAYRCPTGKVTIGYGHTRTAKEGQVISKAAAESLLMEDVEDAEKIVDRLVNVPLNQNQFDALVSFVFNIGAGKFGSSTLLKRLNAGNYAGAAKEFSRWVFGGGVRLAGLANRRADEKTLFLRPINNQGRRA
jgi:lysozyme